MLHLMININGTTEYILVEDEDMGDCGLGGGGNSLIYYCCPNNHCSDIDLFSIIQVILVDGVIVIQKYFV